MDTPAAQDLGGLLIPPASGEGSGAGAPAADGSASAQVVKQRKQRSDVGQPRGSRAKDSAGSVPAISQAQFAALYDPKIWANALSAPADAMAAMTGKAHWQLAETERQNLGATGAIAAQCFAVTDPRYLAVSLAFITILEVYGLRLVKDWNDERERKKKEEEKKKNLFEGGKS